MISLPLSFIMYGGTDRFRRHTAQRTQPLPVRKRSRRWPAGVDQASSGSELVRDRGFHIGDLQVELPRELLCRLPEAFGPFGEAGCTYAEHRRRAGVDGRVDQDA